MPLMSEDHLKEVGLAAMGDRLKLRDLCNPSKFSDREDKLGKLRELIASSRAQKRRNHPADSSSSRRKPRLKETAFRIRMETLGKGPLQTKKGSTRRKKPDLGSPKKL